MNECILCYVVVYMHGMQKILLLSIRVLVLQANAERDILYAMALKSLHPLTSGLKFAFQSENNLYLGMDFIPGGNLRELIKRMKFLPEVILHFYLLIQKYLNSKYI